MNNRFGAANKITIFFILIIASAVGYYAGSQKENQPISLKTDIYPLEVGGSELINQVPITPSEQQEAPKKTEQTNVPVPVPPSSNVDSCTTIDVSGEYFISRDITNLKSEPCIKIKNVDSVTLNCQSHLITSKNENYAIYVVGASNFKINNCKLASALDVPINTASQHMLRIENSKHGEINNSIVGGNSATIDRSSFTNIQNSTFNNQLIVFKSNNIVIKGNVFSNGSDNIVLQEGSNNSVISNFIDGKSDGVFLGEDLSIGADDGIVIKDESGDTIQENTMQNFYDCAIENSGFIFDTKIIGNKIDNTGVCFLGGWYYSSVKGITVKDNIVNNTPNLFLFFRQYPLKPGEKYIYFQNNTFENNKLSNPKLNTQLSFASRFFFDGSNVPIQNHIFGNNILKNNNFTKITKPLFLTPSNIITDGGGNICVGAKTEAKGGGDQIPFNCN
jgi:hypothetical protein